MTWLKRQSFLGPDSDAILRRTKVGLVGLGGGGSHVGQQLAHVGVGRFGLFDPDVIELHNLNRVVGATANDVKRRRLKVQIARRLIKGIQPAANITAVAAEWQNAIEELRTCDIVVGGVDSFRARDELERFCRQNLIPYIDMGMDVTDLGGDYLVAGQVLLSAPGYPCLRCLGVVTEDRLAEEARNYGAAGGRPQVVWPNAILASAAVGFIMQWVTPWHGRAVGGAFRELDANNNTLRESPKWRTLIERSCPHHPSNERGDPRFDIRTWREACPAQLPSMYAKILRTISPRRDDIL